MAPPDLVTGPLDEQPVRGQARAQPLPHRRHLLLVVLAQYVRRADQRRAGPALQRHLEPAVPEAEPLALVRLRRRDPRRFDLDADHPHPRRRLPQPGQQLHRRPRRGPVAEVHRDRSLRPPQRRPVRGRDPAVHPAQPVRVRRPAGHRAHRAARGRGGAGGHAPRVSGGDPPEEKRADRAANTEEKTPAPGMRGTAVRVALLGGRPARSVSRALPLPAPSSTPPSEREELLS